MLIGYGRVSTADQNLHLQQDALTRAGCERVFTDQASGARGDRRGLADALSLARVPWCSIILRKVFGVAGAAHMNHARLHYRYAWPSGDWGSLPIEGGIEAAYRADLEAAADRVALQRDIEERLNRVRSPFRTAESFMIEEIIDPRDTRPLLCEWANLAAPLRAAGPVATGMRP
jgi:acetyl-CoA carboxylase carboxyltransferase component